VHSCFPHASYMPCSAYTPWLYHSNSIWQRIQIMKLPIMQFSPASSYFTSLQFKYFPQHPVLKSAYTSLM
jgi:hypothetical protein